MDTSATEAKITATGRTRWLRHQAPSRSVRSLWRAAVPVTSAMAGGIQEALLCRIEGVDSTEKQVVSDGHS